MRTLLLASALSLTLAVPACAADEPPDAFVLPSWMDVDYSTPVPDFSELLAGVALPTDACELLATTSSMPFESTPAEITAMAAHRVAMEALSALALRKSNGQPVRFDPQP